MKKTFGVFVSLALANLAMAEDGKPYRLAITTQADNACVEGVEVVLSVKAERSPGFNMSPAEFLEPLKHPFLTGILYPRNRTEIFVVDRLVKKDPSALCQAVEEKPRTYTVTFGEEYKGVGLAYNAILKIKNDKTSKFQVTIDKEDTIVSAYEIVDPLQPVFYRNLEVGQK